MSVKNKFEKLSGVIKDEGQKAAVALKDGGQKAVVVLKDGGQKAGALAIGAKDQILDVAGNTKLAVERKLYCPVLFDDYCQDSFVLPRVVRLTDIDEHSNSLACKGAIFYNPVIAKVPVLEIPRQNIHLLGLEFNPNTDGVIYLRNPYVSNMYIDIQIYFDFIKSQRRIELEKIANTLGATHISVEIAERKSDFISIKGRKGFSGKDISDKENKTEARERISAEVQLKGYTVKECVSDMTFAGGTPQRPDLVYYKYDDDIKNLIDMQMGPNPILRKNYKLDFSSTHDLSVSAAASIDAVLKKLSLTGEDSISGQVEQEKKTCFKYSIEF